MDVIDLGRRTQFPVHGLLDADRDDVLGRTVDFFARQHRRTARDPREPPSDLAVEHLIVTGDRNRIEALATGFEHESPRRHAVAAPRRAVDVKVGGEHAIAANGHRRPDGGRSPTVPMTIDRKIKLPATRRRFISLRTTPPPLAGGSTRPPALRNRPRRRSSRSLDVPGRPPPTRRRCDPRPHERSGSRQSGPS